MPFARSFFVKKVSVMSTASMSASKLKPSLSVSTALSMGDYDSIFTTVSLCFTNRPRLLLTERSRRRFVRSFLLSVRRSVELVAQ